MKVLMIAALAAACAGDATAAECWTVGNFTGYSSSEGNGGVIQADGFAGRTFDVEIDGLRAKVSDHSDMVCRAVTPREVVCSSNVDKESFVIAAWLLDTEAKTVTHTRLAAGYGPLDGGRLMTGKILGRCQPAK
jgi:hypothetical protein